MKFTLEIELGNDAMRTKADLIDALRVTVVQALRLADGISMHPSAPIRDENGNIVGKWEVTT